jgi:hypothetical protein
MDVEGRRKMAEKRWQKKDFPARTFSHSRLIQLPLSGRRGTPPPADRQEIDSNSASPLTACYHRGIDGLVVVALFLPQLN